MMEYEGSDFIWDKAKETVNISKHGVDFTTASFAFMDPERKLYTDALHSKHEERFFCLGKVDNRVLTVRFVFRDEKIRIIGAAHWRKGARQYEKEKN